MPGNYEVGYGKPPSHTQFKKGQSGNPEGRPKGTRNLKTDLKEELEEQILVREGAKERQMSKQRALLKSLTTKAIKGDTRAATVVLNMVLRLLEEDGADEAEAPLSEDERAVFEVLEQRLMRKRRIEANDNPAKRAKNDRCQKGRSQKRRTGKRHGKR